MPLKQQQAEVQSASFNFLDDGLEKRMQIMTNTRRLAVALGN
jgi:hypothetical protein